MKRPSTCVWKDGEPRSPQIKEALLDVLIALFSCLHQRPPAEGLQFPPGRQHLEPFGHHRGLLLHALRRHEQPDRGVTHPVRPGPGRSLRYAL